MRGKAFVPFMLKRGDGSTLSLDFASMGELDSRFTFSRASTATVINSSGLVQYANHNLVANSAFAGSGMGTGWVQNGAAATNSGTGTLTFSVTTAALSYASRSIATASGLRYSAAVNVSSITGTIQYQEVLAIAGTISSTQMYRDGVAVSGSATAQPGLISITWTSGGSNTIRFGVGASGNNQTNVTVAANAPRAIAGEATQPAYFASTASDAYHAPRFDYDPTTLAARGLLIEASATNICTRSEDFANAVWVADNGSATNPSVSVVSQAAPNGGASVNRITFNKTGGTFSRIRQTLVGTSGATYTFSVWMKANTANGAAATQNVGLRIGADTGGFNCAVTTTWTRFSYSYALSGTDASAQIMLWDNIAGNDETADVLVWGAQLETGSGSSSYIPTGSSSVQRATDSCSMTGTNFSSWFGSPTAFSMLFEGIAQISANYGRVLCLSSGANTTSGIPNFNFGLSAATSNRPFINAYILSNNNIDTYAPAGAALTNGVPFKIGLRHQTSSHYITRGNSLGATNSYAGFAAGLANLYFGNTDGSTHRSVHYTRVKFWPFALSNAQLDSFAT